MADDTLTTTVSDKDTVEWIRSKVRDGEFTSEDEFLPIIFDPGAQDGLFEIEEYLGQRFSPRNAAQRMTAPSNLNQSLCSSNCVPRFSQCPSNSPCSPRSRSSSAAPRCCSSADLNTPSFSSATAILRSHSAIASSAAATSSSSSFSLIGFSFFGERFFRLCSSACNGCCLRRRCCNETCNRSSYFLRPTLFSPQVILIVPGIDMYAPVFHLEYPRRQPVDEVAVVRHKQHCSREIRGSHPAAHPSPAESRWFVGSSSSSMFAGDTSIFAIA